MSYIRTFSGRQFHPLAPRIGDVCIEDIAHALAAKCRFGGHCTRFYSIAEHSVLVSRLVALEYGRSDLSLHGLLHDAAEAYLADIPSPIKGWFADFETLESNVLKAVSETVGVEYGGFSAKEVLWSDTVMLHIEQLSLMNGPEPAAITDRSRAMTLFDRHDELRPVGLLPKDAEALFLRTYEGYVPTKGCYQYEDSA